MKRISFILILMGLSLSLHAQVPQQPDSCQSDTSYHPNQISLNLGLSGGVSLFFSGNNASPYYNQHGFFLHIPLVFYYDFTPHWRLISGLRYDFNWNPMYYTVEPTDSDGLDFPTTPTTATQHAHHFSSYVGIPVEIEWHPWPAHKRHLSLSVDAFAGYAVTNRIRLANKLMPVGQESSTVIQTPLNPWKVEVGFTVSTSLIGLIHGVRLFANLLPTYQDPATGQKIYTSGVSVFL